MPAVNIGLLTISVCCCQ